MGEASRFPSGPAKCEVFNEADPCTLFSDVLYKSTFPQHFASKFFLFLSTLSQLRRSYATPTLSIGGIVFEVAFGGVSDGVGTGRIECARAAPVTYRRDRR
jgi:hypothetical protein